MHGRVSDQEVQAIYERLGMNRPLLVQYLDFLRHAAAAISASASSRTRPSPR
jgi:ABC-type dipeptide/oligopeptide/nickel transport systems, permease components